VHLWGHPWALLSVRQSVLLWVYRWEHSWVNPWVLLSVHLWGHP
jgi:hypothetical protein